MATESEIFKYILQMEGEEAVKKAAAAAALAEQKFQALYSTLGKGAPATKAAASSMIDLQNELKKLEKAANTSGQSMLKFGRIMDDVQYIPSQGLRPIINNVMELAPKLGIAMIAVQLLYENWDKISALWGQGHTLTEAERMDELGKATRRTADEEREYQALKERAKNIEAQAGKTEAQQKQAADVNKLVVEGPKSKLNAAVESIFGKAFDAAVDQKLLDEQKAALEHLQGAQARQAQNAGLGLGFLNDTEEMLGTPGSIRASQARLDKANEAVSTNRGQMTTDKLGGLSSDPKKLEDFITALQKKGGNEELVRDLKAILVEAKKDPKVRAQEQSDREMYAARMDAQEAAANLDMKAKEDAKEAASKKQADEADRINAGLDAEQASLDFHGSKAAAALGSGRLGRLAATGDLGREDVRGGLKRLGHSDEDIDLLTDRVFMEMKKKGDDQRAKRGGELGLNANEAAQQIRIDQQKPLNDAFEQYGKSIQEIQKQAQDARRNKTSQVIDSAGLASSIQASVGASDPQLKMVQEFQKANETLLKILAKPENQALILGR